MKDLNKRPGRSWPSFVLLAELDIVRWCRLINVIGWFGKQPLTGFLLTMVRPVGESTNAESRCDRLRCPRDHRQRSVCCCVLPRYLRSFVRLNH
jgi:hypothetical protein